MTHPIKTANEDAQRFFDQGLRLIYAYNFVEATQAFRRAADLDSNTPMPYWGMALAASPNYNSWQMNRVRREAGRTAILRARELSSLGSSKERAYINALAEIFPDQNAEASGLNYADAMRRLAEQYPDDQDAATLYAAALMNLHPWHLWNVDGTPAAETPEVVSVLEGVLRRSPTHEGANHLYIHAMEGSPFPQRALESARLLETLAPSAGHLVHMPAHIYFRTGNYAGAVKSSLSAEQADRVYAAQQSMPNPSYVLGYGNHNLYFLANAANMDGEFDIASRAAGQLEKSHFEAFRTMGILVPLRFGRWDSVLALDAPDVNEPGLTFFWHYARACSFARKGKLQEANSEEALMALSYERIPAGRAFGMFFNDWSTLSELATTTLDAIIAGSRGDSGSAVAFWRSAISVQDEMNFDDLPDWYYPVRESLGGELLRLGHAAEAEQVFRKDLEKNPRNPRSLFGLWKALENQGSKDAESMRQSFEQSWKGSTNLLRIEDL